MSKNAIELTLDPLAVLGVLRRRIRLVGTPGTSAGNGKAKRELILADYLVAGSVENP